MKSSSIVEYQKLMQEGFPVRMSYEKLLLAYGLSKKFSSCSDHLDTVLRSICLHRNDYKIGSNMIFLRPVKNLDAILHPTRDMLAKVENVIERRILIYNIWNKISEKLLQHHLESQIKVSLNESKKKNENQLALGTTFKEKKITSVDIKKK